MNRSATLLLGVIAVVALLPTVGCRGTRTDVDVPGPPPSREASASSVEGTSSAPRERELRADDPGFAGIMRSLESTVSRHLGQPVRLEYRGGSVVASFATVLAEPFAPDGSAIDFDAYPEYAPAIEAGAFDSQVQALLRRQGEGWVVLEFVLGATDVQFVEFWRRHNVPGVDLEADRPGQQ